MDTVRRPFHESLAEFIRAALSIQELAQIARLIELTAIPKNHDAIMGAWADKCGQLEFDQQLTARILAILEEQKTAAEETERAKLDAVAKAAAEAGIPGNPASIS